MTGSKDGDKDASYTYTWKNGSTGATLTGISADRLTSCTVTVTAVNKLGELTAQLSVPEAPKADTSVTASTIKVSVQRITVRQQKSTLSACIRITNWSRQLKLRILRYRSMVLLLLLTTR